MGFKEKISLAKADKKKLIYLLSAAMFIIVFLMFFDGGEEKKADTQVVPDTSTTSSYDKSNDLAAVLQGIAGAGAVNVAIEYQGDSLKEYAYNEETSERISGGEDNGTETTKSKEMVLLKGDETPVVVKETYPEIKGVVIVADGGGDANVRKALMDATTTYLDIGANRVEICGREVAQ